MSQDFSSALKIIKQIIKLLDLAGNIEIFTSWKDLADYFICLSLMDANRKELLEVIRNIDFN